MNLTSSSYENWLSKFTWETHLNKTLLNLHCGNIPPKADPTPVSKSADILLLAPCLGKNSSSPS